MPALIGNVNNVCFVSSSFPATRRITLVTKLNDIDNAMTYVEILIINSAYIYFKFNKDNLDAMEPWFVLVIVRLHVMLTIFHR